MCLFNSPREHHYKVHHVPAVSQVGALVEGKSQRKNLNARLKTENSNEIGLCVILREKENTQCLDLLTSDFQIVLCILEQKGTDEIMFIWQC